MAAYRTSLPSPLGTLTLASDGEAITGLWMEGQVYFPDLGGWEDRPEVPVFAQAELWLSAYFRREPTPPVPLLSPHGTPFQLSVWQLLTEIPLGQTVSYGDLARRLRDQGHHASPRAVGSAVGRNPISLLIPCHRVLGADGSLTGYAGGLERKTWLLELEGVHLPLRPAPTEKPR